MLRRLLADGHHVVATARGPAPAGIDAAPRLDWTSLDLGEPEASRAWIVRALAGCARPERASLILNAGMVEPLVPTIGLQPAALDRHLRVNLVVPMLLASGFLEASADWAVPRRILAISSGAGRRGIAHWGAYCAAKAGLDGFVRALNAEHAGRVGDASVRAVSLAPGVLDTAMQEAIRGTDAPEQARFRALHADRRLTPPDAAAASILAYLEQDGFGSCEIDDIRNPT